MVHKQSRLPQQQTTPLHKQFSPSHWQHHSRNMSTDSQEVAIDNKMPIVDRYATGEIADEEYNDSIRSQGHRAVLPSLDGSLFECTTSDENTRYHRASVESIDSQILADAIVQENDSDDDDSIMSQIKDMSAVEISSYQQEEQDHPTDAQNAENIHHHDDDDSLTSIVSMAYSMASSSSSSSSDDWDQSNNGKKVVFVHQQNQVHYIPNRSDYTQEELSNVWYRHKDMAVMRMERFEEEATSRQEPEKLIEVPEVDSFPEELSSSSVSLHLNSLLHAHHLAGAFYRGSCKPADTECEARIHAVVDAVMDEQETQWLDEEDDHERLAEISMSFSNACKKDALMRAHLDALEAIPFYLEGKNNNNDQQDNQDPLCNSTRSSASSKEMRKDEEIYPLSPMSVSPKVRMTKLKLRKSGKQKSKTVSECRWNPVSSKRALTRKMITKFEGSTSLPEEDLSDALMPMPKRMASDHGTPDLGSSTQESLRKLAGLTMPMRMASDHGTPGLSKQENLRKLGLSMPQRTVSSSDFSMNSEQEFGEDDDFSVELAPPSIPEASFPSPVPTNNIKVEQKSRTCKFLFKDKKEPNEDAGIYQKMKRKLKGSKKKNKKDKKEKKSKRKKKSNTPKNKKKKAKSANKSLDKESGSPDDRAVVIDLSQPSGLSDEFEKLDAS